MVATANWTCLKDFFWRGKWGEKEREERERQKKNERVICRFGERQRPRKRGRKKRILMVKGGWDDHSRGNIFVRGAVIILRNNYQSCPPLK